MSERAALRDILEVLRRIEERMTANDDALANLETVVSANTDATNAAVTALGSAGGADDISAGVNAAAATVQANTASLTAATAPAGAADGTATPGAQTNEAGTALPPQ